MVRGAHYCCYCFQIVMLCVDYNIEIQGIGCVDSVERSIPLLLACKSPIYAFAHFLNGCRILAYSPFTLKMIEDALSSRIRIECEKHFERKRHPMPRHARINDEPFI